METLCIENLKEKAKKLPQKPGVYRHFGEGKQILYVGKATNLRNRVLSYFSNISRHTPKTKALVNRIVDFEFTIVQSSEQALVLENNLIKHHQPPFNILLRDDKTYPFLRLDLNEDWPRLRIVRRMGADGAQYFGPYTSPKDLRTLIEALSQQYPLVRCSPTVFKTVKRPCNFYHIKKCLAPCHLAVNHSSYMAMIEDVMAVLKGDIEELSVRLESKMLSYANRMQFELAGKERDRIRAVKALNTPKTLALLAPDSAECLALGMTPEGRVQCTWIKVSESRIVRMRTCHGDAVTSELDKDAVASVFITTIEQVLDDKSLAKELYIIMPSGLFHLIKPQKLTLNHFLKMRFPTIQKVEWGCGEEHFSNPKAKSLVMFSLREMEMGLKKQTPQPYDALVELAKVMKLAKTPSRLECYDISTFRGGATYGSQVVFLEGESRTDQYRLYKLKTILEDSNDFVCLREVLERRLGRLTAEEKVGLVLIVDGGLPQVKAAQSLLNELGLESIPLIGLAKARVADMKGFQKGPSVLHTHERLVKWDGKGSIENHLSYTTYALLEGSPLYRLMTHIRDEAHRFAITAHRKGRSKKTLSSVLDGLEGIGPMRKRKLLEKFGSVMQLRQASVEDIASCISVSPEFAKRILESLDLALPRTH